jgi:SsrA-binding protein
MNSKQKDSSIELIAENRKARHNFAVNETFECGIMLLGNEVKSLRARHVNFSDSYAMLKAGEIFLIGLKIEKYAFATYTTHEVDRTRKLLLHKKEIKKISRDLKEKGFTLVPLKIYFKNGKAKVMIGLAKGQTKYDKRHAIKKRETDIDLRRIKSIKFS